MPTRQSVTEQSYGPVISTITQMLDAVKRDGSIRADADAADVLLLTAALWSAPGGEEDRSQRMLGLTLDGLRPPLSQQTQTLRVRPRRLDHAVAAAERLLLLASTRRPTVGRPRPVFRRRVGATRLCATLEAVKLTGSLCVVLRVEGRLDHRFFLAGRVVITYTGAVATGSSCSVVSVRTAAVV